MRCIDNLIAPNVAVLKTYFHSIDPDESFISILMPCYFRFNLFTVCTKKRVKVMVFNKLKENSKDYGLIKTPPPNQEEKASFSELRRMKSIDTLIGAVMLFLENLKYQFLIRAGINGLFGWAVQLFWVRAWYDHY